MKTTIDIPDDVIYHAKIVSAQKRMTLKSLIISGLKRELAGESGAPSESESLIEALSKGRNREPVGRLNREELYDRQVLR